MATIYANYEVLSLSGTQTFLTGKETNYVTASTIHQLFCLSPGSIIITPAAGSTFTWAATSGQSIDVITKGTTVSSGTFIAFRSKFIPPQGRGTSGGWAV